MNLATSQIEKADKSTNEQELEIVLRHQYETDLNSALESIKAFRTKHEVDKSIKMQWLKDNGYQDDEENLDILIEESNQSLV